jgi:hypothetical protein
MNQSPEQKRPFRKLVLPLGLYLILSLLYLAIIPPGESPDEPGHLQCIEQVSRLKRIPQFSAPPQGIWWQRETIVSERMCFHMPLYYVAGGVLQMAVESTIGGTLDYQYPATNPNGPSPSMFLHPDEGLFLGLTEPATSTALRMLSIILGAIMIILTYIFALNFFPEKHNVALVSAILMAGWPQFLFMSRAISNDILTAVLSLAVLTTLIALGNPNRYIWAALLTGLSVLTKSTALFVVAAVIGSFVIELIVNRDRWRNYVKPGIAILVIFTGTAALIFFHSTISENFRISYGSFGRISEAALGISYWIDVFTFSLRSGVAYLGWMNVRAPGLIIYGWWIVIGIGLVKGIWETVRFSSDINHRLKLVIISLWVLGLFITYFRINLNRFQPQIRFVFVLLPIVTAFTSYGYFSLLSSHRRIIERHVIVLGILLLLFNIGLLVFLVLPTYRPDFL